MAYRGDDINIMLKQTWLMSVKQHNLGHLYDYISYYVLNFFACQEQREEYHVSRQEEI